MVRIQRVVLAVAAAALTLPAWGAAPTGRVPEVRRFAQEYLPWEPDSRVTVTPVPAENLPGFEAYRVERKGKYDKLDTTTTYFVSSDGRWIFTGSVVKSTMPAAKIRPIRSDADVAGIGDYFGKLFNSRATAVLDPRMDKAGVRGVDVRLDTGYFTQVMPVYVAADGTFLLAGQLWKLAEDVAQQRKALISLSDSPWQGVKDPKIVIAEYADMECPFCKKRGLEMDKLMDKYADKLKIRRYYKYYPLWANHVWSTKAASAAVCLSRFNPNLVFQLKGLCYQNQETLTLEALDRLVFDVADSAGVPRTQFTSCYLQPDSFAPIARDMEEGGRLGVNSTPSYYVNGVFVYWVPDGVMEDLLKSLAGKH